MPIISIHEAKTRLSRLIEKAAADEEIIIAKAGRPIAKWTLHKPEGPMTGFIALPISSEHVAGVAYLPMIHSDPFDRLLISQALAMPARFVNVGATLADCSKLVGWIGKS
ncbi:type II toxin-antitoxin system prevent-host-death family antitoxin [Nitrosomonas sp.]|uniref:type II toxin-antitoxin system prevent-host-death family antitoxin n=1 Tax=Nitrosomonas sp. TaxID=42353 RepID=UPI0032EDCFDF